MTRAEMAARMRALAKARRRPKNRRPPVPKDGDARLRVPRWQVVR